MRYARSGSPARRQLGDRRMLRHRMFWEASWHRAEHVLVKRSPHARSCALSVGRVERPDKHQNTCCDFLYIIIMCHIYIFFGTQRYGKKSARREREPKKKILLSFFFLLLFFLTRQSRQIACLASRGRKKSPPPLQQKVAFSLLFFHLQKKRVLAKISGHAKRKDEKKFFF